MKVSIVINTLNRGYFLKRLLDSLKYLNYKNFEVIVVNGPSTDKTKDLILPYMNAIKYRECPVANLSISRNIGIKAAAGDIVAFIDDDAIPDKLWLDDLVSVYEKDSSIGGVGGKIYDGCRLGVFQVEYATINKFGIPNTDYKLPQDFNDSNGDNFNIMVGCNCSFRKKALLDVGGFDEYYEYFHDESDVAVRVIRKGYKIIHHTRAIVHHSFAASDLRDNNRIVKNWFPIIKNLIYFGVKNSLLKGVLTKKELYKVLREKSVVFKEKMYYDCKFAYTKYIKYRNIFNKAFEKGFNDGYNNERLLNYKLEADEEFKEYNYKLVPNILNICMLCRDDIFKQLGGTAKHTFELATSYAKLGHNVHVITEGDGLSYMKDGVNIHFAKPIDLSEVSIDLKKYNICNHNIQYSYGILKTFNIINAMYNIDIIESALWNYEGFAISQLSNKPIVVRLQTPSLIVNEIHKLGKNNDLMLNANFEEKFMQVATGLIYISDAIKETILEKYDIKFEGRSKKVYLGIDEYKGEIQKKQSNNDSVVVFFIGRLERRKGLQNIVDSLSTIMENYPNTIFRIAGQNNIIDNELKTTFMKYCLKKYSGKKWLKNIQFLGVISNEDKEKELSNCDIFISPSTYESFGLIFIEAMRHKLPVIGCNIGGMKEIIINDRTGLLITPNNTEEFIIALSKLIEDKQMRINMGVNGYNRYLDVFTSRKAAENSIEYYREVIKNHDR